MLFETKKQKIKRILTEISKFPIIAFKTELDRTLNDIENGNIPLDHKIVGDFTPELILSQENWKYNPKVIHIILSLVVAECVQSALAAHKIKAHQMTPELRKMAHDVTEPHFIQLFRNQVGIDVFEEYKAANPTEF